MNENSTAAQTGSENPSSPGADAGGRPPAERSIRDSVSRALERAEVDLGSPAPNETDKARAVLKDGAGADEKVVEADADKRRKAAETVDRETRKQAEAAEKGAGDKDGKKTEAKDKADVGDKDGKTDKKADAKKDGEKAGEKADGKGERQRDEGGRYASDKKEPEVGGDEDTDDKVSDPPQRMSEAAKSAWAKAPKEIRGDVHRMVREYEGGIAKHKESAGQWDGLMSALSPVKTKDGKPVSYADLTKSMNTTPKQALDNYIAVDMKLSEDPIGTIDTLLRNRGMDFRKVAEAYLKLDPDTIKHHQDLQAERDKVARLEREKAEGANTATVEKRRQVDADIEKFYTDNPRLATDKELEATFGKLFVSGAARTLQEALELALLKHPRKAPDTSSPDTAAQTRKSDLSESGARTTASDATSRRERSKTIKDSADRALRDVGL